LGNDHPHGGDGRDTLLAGAGTDRLEGQRDEDLQAGGPTHYDNHYQALERFRATWNSRESLGFRTEQLVEGTGAYQSGTGLRPERALTVIDDPMKDRYFGGQEDGFCPGLVAPDVLEDFEPLTSVIWLSSWNCNSIGGADWCCAPTRSWGSSFDGKPKTTECHLQIRTRLRLAVNRPEPGRP
jgi:hypothetical protein